MSESKHTQGPWETKQSTFVHSKRGEFVADCSYPAASDQSEFSANARLIAAAPELLEALEEAIIEFEGLPHSLGYESTHLYKWRAAIAKARE